MAEVFYGVHYASPLGDILLAADEQALVGLWLERQKYISSTMPDGICMMGGHSVLRQGMEWLDDYFSGQQPALRDLPLAPHGGEFRQQVWAALKEIPYGEVTTYGAIAKKVAVRLGRTRMSPQAVGGAVGHNPISIIIPCHRVVGADGSLTGYAGGLDKKVRLLQHEGVDVSRLFIPQMSTVP